METFVNLKGRAGRMKRGSRHAAGLFVVALSAVKGPHWRNDLARLKEAANARHEARHSTRHEASQ